LLLTAATATSLISIGIGDFLDQLPWDFATWFETGDSDEQATTSKNPDNGGYNYELKRPLHEHLRMRRVECKRADYPALGKLLSNSSVDLVIGRRNEYVEGTTKGFQIVRVSNRSHEGFAVVAQDR
jgi:hypothetical protein